MCAACMRSATWLLSCVPPGRTGTSSTRSGAAWPTRHCWSARTCAKAWARCAAARARYSARCRPTLRPVAGKVHGLPTQVLATPRADQQIAGLDRTRAKTFGEFLNDLAVQGYKTLRYRLSGPTPVDHVCAQHLPAP